MGNTLSLSLKIPIKENNNRISFGNNDLLYNNKLIKNQNYHNYINYFYDRNPINIESYRIPEGFHSYYKLIIDDILVNEVFKK